MASVYKKRKTWYIRYKSAAGRWIACATAATTKTEVRRLAIERDQRAETALWFGDVVGARWNRSISGAHAVVAGYLFERDRFTCE